MFFIIFLIMLALFLIIGSFKKKWVPFMGITLVTYLLIFGTFMMLFFASYVDNSYEVYSTEKVKIKEIFIVQLKATYICARDINNKEYCLNQVRFKTEVKEINSSQYIQIEYRKLTEKGKKVAFWFGIIPEKDVIYYIVEGDK